MNHSTLLHGPFSLDYPVTTDSDYTSTQRPFSGSSGFSMDDDDHNRRVNSLGHPLAQPVSIPASSGMRYNGHDVPFATSPTMLMSSADSCSEPFSPTCTSLYSHSPSLSYDRMADFRPHQVPPLSLPDPFSQPPHPRSHGSAVPGSAGMLGKTDSFPGTYTLHRGPFPPPPLSGFNDQMSPYTSTPRVLDNTIDRPPGYVLGQTGNMYMDTAMPRLSRAIDDAPPFNETSILHRVIVGNLASGQTVKPEIQAKIHNNKRFLHVDDKWTCYRRNYLAVTCSFSLHPYSTGPFYIKFPDQSTEQIRTFAVEISAIVNAQYSEVRELVQHTPKRDKESERPPGRIVLQPCQPSHLGLGHSPATTSNNGSQHGFALASQPTGLLDYNSSYTITATTTTTTTNSSSTSHPPHPPTQHTFERIQFQKATANNGKRRAQQQYYNLVVDLYAEVTEPGGSQWVKIARRPSHPMVVRGRSPGHYRDGRRDSSTSMGPDKSTGGSGDSSGTTMLSHHGVGHTPRSNLALAYDTTSRSGGGRGGGGGGAPYGRPDYHHQVKSEQSPLSDNSPHISSSSSSAFDIGILNDSMDHMDTIKAASRMGSYDGAFSLASPLDRKAGGGGGGGGDAETGGPFRPTLPSSSFEYNTFTKDSEVSSSFPDTVASMVSMMPNEQSNTASYIRNPPRLPSQPASTTSTGGYDPIYSVRDDSSYGRFDPVQNAQGLCT